MNVDDHHENLDGELDRVVRDALAADVNRQGVERLEQFWRVQSRKDRWRRRAYFAAPAAAAAMILVGLLLVAKKGDEGVRIVKVSPAPAPSGGDVEGVGGTSEGVANMNEPSPDPSLDGREDGTPGLVGRTPTEYERLIFIARTGKPTPTTAESRVDEAIRRPGENHEQVLAEVEKSGGVEGLMRAAKRTNDVKLRRASIERLLAIGSDEALLGFLSLVRDGSTRASSLAAANAASKLTLDALLGLLDHDDKSVRLSAALVLGHVNGPEVTQALIARVTEQPSGATEAWMALMACRGETAKQFVAYAATRPQLLGHLNGARVQMAYVVP